MEKQARDFYFLPEPQSLELLDQEFVIGYDSRLVLGSCVPMQCRESVRLLKADMETYLGFDLGLHRGERNCREGDIYLGIREEMEAQEYRLEIMEKRVFLAGGSPDGLRYGIQTLRQLVRQKGAVLPCMVIRDFPQVENRGFYHDVTRGRIPTLAWLKRLAERMAYYKLNQLQIYIEHSYLFDGLSEVWRDDTPLTAEDILELDAYCQELGIELVPSLASFGHLYKLLRTKQYARLCELEGEADRPFSFADRQAHHTIDVSNEDSLKLIKGMISEFMELFSSRQFNLCADETFDLGKGRNRERAEAEGTASMYMDYVKELCSFLLENGRRPMFWGDILCGFPEKLGELPEETICLNWGYAPDESEENARKLYEAGAIQYLCPGAAGWNQWVNRLEDSYSNIRRMCSYAVKYRALGVLTTDWGDYGHINHPEFSLPAMIYGAVLSWNRSAPSFEELNWQISRVEYQDSRGELLSVAARIPACCDFPWETAVRYRECRGTEEERRQIFLTSDCSGAGAHNKMLAEISRRLSALISGMDTAARGAVLPYLIAVQGIQLFNSIGAHIASVRYQLETDEIQEPGELANRLETWFHQYKLLWRRVSRESELYQLQQVIDWYADQLREDTVL